MTGFRSAKAQALLYYLAATKRPQPRLVLAGLFWGGVDDHYARRNLNRTLSNLTDLVGDHLAITRQTLAFDRSQPYWLDVEAFEAAATITPAGGRVDAMTQAVELYRGDFLEGFYIHDAPEFEQWVSAERTRLREVMLQVLHALADHYAAHGDLGRAIDYVRQGLKLEPWREEAHRQLMVLLAKSGQRSAALAQYELCRQTLAAELNVEPDAATLALMARIRSGELDQVTRGQGPSTASPLASEQKKLTTSEMTSEGQRTAERNDAAREPHPVRHTQHGEIEPPPHNLSLQSTPFIGREAELAEIAGLLDEPDCRLLTLAGPGGMGKTRLALRAAERIVETYTRHGKFTQGVFFVPLEALRDATNIVSSIISVLADEIGVPLHASAPLQEQLLDFLRDKAILLVLDNFEHLISGATLLSAILRRAPAVKLLVTSRESLDLQEEWFYSIGGMSLPTTTPNNSATEGEYDAIRFFVQCARRTKPGFALALEHAAVLRICQMVEGMPLGIELAAAWLSALTPQQIVCELERGLDILTTRFQNTPARHRSMRAVMEHSWNLLAAGEQEVAARLCVFPGSFDLEAARQIAGASLPMLATLVEKALVRVTPDRRYQIHELMRQYMAERLTSTATFALRDTHATYYAGLLHQQQPYLFTATYKEVLGVVAAEFDNVRHAWQWIVETISRGREGLPVTTLLQQMAEVWTAYHLFKALSLSGQALFGHATHVMEAAGWVANDGSRPAQPHQQAAWVHVRLYTGLFYQEIGHYRTSLTIAEEALVICRSLNVEYDLVRALLLYGHTQTRRGAYDAAIATLQEALDLCRRLGWAAGCAEALIGLGLTASSQGHYAEAQTYLYEALALGQELGYQPWITRTLTILGTTYSRQRDYQRALPFYERALTIAQAEGYQTQIMVLTSNLGGVQRGFGRYQLSVTSYERSLALARSMSDRRWIAANLNGIAITYLELHDLTAAERALREALTVAHHSESTPDTLGSISLLGHVLARRGQMKMALRALTFAEQHPSVMARDRLYNEPLLAELHSELSVTFFDEATTWAAGQSLDEVVRWLEHSEVTVSQ
ncbi:MAG TPA: tetratricopeptide repeat protein [Caldilineaceae bacterium]|nr:tetratricopeptide repeat protein [Caldilineaceae bacterium]